MVLFALGFFFFFPFKTYFLFFLLPILCSVPCFLSGLIMPSFFFIKPPTCRFHSFLQGATKTCCKVECGQHRSERPTAGPTLPWPAHPHVFNGLPNNGILQGQPDFYLLGLQTWAKWINRTTVCLGERIILWISKTKIKCVKVKVILLFLYFFKLYFLKLLHRILWNCQGINDPTQTIATNNSTKSLLKEMLCKYLTVYLSFCACMFQCFLQQKKDSLIIHMWFFKSQYKFLMALNATKWHE